jgi:hypothetical protein
MDSLPRLRGRVGRGSRLLRVCGSHHFFQDLFQALKLISAKRGVERIPVGLPPPRPPPQAGEGDAGAMRGGYMPAGTAT